MGEAMTPDEMERAIYDAFAAPYAEYITPALAQQFAISARNAMHRIQAGMHNSGQLAAPPKKPAAPPKPSREERNQHIVGDYQQGDSIEAIAKRVDLSTKQVYRILADHGVELRSQATPDEPLSAPEPAPRLHVALPASGKLSDMTLRERIAARRTGVLHEQTA
jgi:transposase-like protein